MKTKRKNWVFECPKHGLEEGMFCSRAYDEKYCEKWHFVEYTLKKIRTTKASKIEQVRIMNLTRSYNGHLPEN